MKEDEEEDQSILRNIMCLNPDSGRRMDDIWARGQTLKTVAKSLQMVEGKCISVVDFWEDMNSFLAQ